MSYQCEDGVIALRKLEARANTSMKYDDRKAYFDMKKKILRKLFLNWRVTA